MKGLIVLLLAMALTGCWHIGLPLGQDDLDQVRTGARTLLLLRLIGTDQHGSTRQPLIGSFSADPTTMGHLSTNANLVLTGTNNVLLTGIAASTAPFTVLSYTGALTGGVGNLALVGGSANYRSPTFSDATPNIITLSVGSESRTWTAATNNKWDVTTTANWAEGDQKFFQLDSVTFGDTGAGTVAVTGTVRPSSITVDSTANYTFTMATAADLIAGAGTLTKRGTGTSPKRAG